MRAIAVLALAIALPVAGMAEGPMEPPGTQHYIDPAKLPAPTAGFVNPVHRVDRAATDRLLVPAGFKAEVFADGLDNPRWMAVAPNGDVFLTSRGPEKSRSCATSMATAAPM